MAFAIPRIVVCAFALPEHTKAVLYCVKWKVFNSPYSGKLFNCTEDAVASLISHLHCILILLKFMMKANFSCQIPL